MYSCNSLVGVQAGKQHIAAIPSRLKASNNAFLLFPDWNTVKAGNQRTPAVSLLGKRQITIYSTVYLHFPCWSKGRTELIPAVPLLDLSTGM